MINNPFGIHLARAEDSNWKWKYEPPKDDVLDQAIQQRIKALINTINLQLEIDPQKIRSIDLMLKADGKGRMVLHLSGEADVAVELNCLESKARKEFKKLSRIVKKLNFCQPDLSGSMIAADRNSDQNPSFRQRVVHFFQCYVSYYLFIRPVVRQQIKTIIQDKSSEQWEELYIHNGDWFAQIKREVIKKNPDLEEIFTSEDFDSIINDLFLEQINKKLERNKQKKWGVSKLYDLGVQRLLNHFRLNPSSQLMEFELTSIHPMQMPLEALARIPINNGNRMVLAKVWKGVIGALFQLGQLGDMNQNRESEKSISQARFANHYYNARQLIPDEIRNELKLFCEELDQQRSLESIHHFAFEHTHQIYQQTIYPEFKEFLNDIRDQQDATLALGCLAQELNQESRIDDLLSKIFPLLNDQERAVFNRERLRTLLYEEIERIAETDFEVLPTQINFLRELREQKALINGLLDSYLTEKKAIESSFSEEERSVPSYLKIPHFSVNEELGDDEYLEKIEEYREKLVDFFLNLKKEYLELIDQDMDIDSEQGQLYSLQLRGIKHLIEALDTKNKDKINEALNHLKNTINELKETQPESVKEKQSEFEMIQGKKQSQIERLNEKYDALIHTEIIGQNLAFVVNRIPIRKENQDFAIALWSGLCEQALSDKVIALLHELQPGDPQLNNLLKPYIQLKAAFKRRKNAPGMFKINIREKMSVLEKRLSKETLAQLKLLIEEQGKLWTFNALYGDEVLPAASPAKSTPSSLFTQKQIADLLFTMRIIDSLEANDSVSESEMERFKKVFLQEMKDDKSFQQKIQPLLNSSDPGAEKIMQFVPKILLPIFRRLIPSDLIPESKGTKLPAGINVKMIAFLKSYFKLVKTLSKLGTEAAAINLQLERLLEQYEKDPKSISPQERLTIEQLGILSRFERLANNPAWEWMKKNDLATSTPELKRLQELIEKSCANLEKLENLVLPSASAHYREGNILAYVGEKKEKWQGRPLGLEEKFTALFSDGLIHGAKLYHEENQLKLSHIYGTYVQTNPNLYTLCISDVWEIDILPLISSNMQSVLKNVYGEDWQTVIKEEYLKIEQSLHLQRSEDIDLIRNDQERRFLAGLANHPHLFKKLGIKGIKGHKRESPRNLKKLRQNFDEKESSPEQTCSEFASKTTAASMIELNARLTNKIREQLGDKWDGKNILTQLQAKGVQVPTVVQDYLNGVRHYKEDASITGHARKLLIKILANNGYDKASIELIIRLGDEEIFDLPYSRKERFKAIHPGRMVSLLVDKQCAKRKPAPPALAALIDLK